jgi:predicted nucleotidyltransferase
MQIMTLNKISETVTTAASKYPCIMRIGLFGSYARGDFDNSSDIDLLYDYDSKMTDATIQFLAFGEDVLNAISPLDADFVYIKNLLEIEDDFKSNVLSEVVWVYERAS